MHCTAIDLHDGGHIMIELLPRSPGSGIGQARQSLVAPSVYLDTWAIREFAENPTLGDRLRTILLGKGGTLVLSDINMVEFTTYEDRSHTEAAGKLFDSLLPHLFLMRCDPTVVVQNEEAVLAGERQRSPAGDSRALAEFAAAADRRRGQFSAAAWFSIVHSEREKLRHQLAGIAKVFYQQIDRLRARMEEEPDSLKLIPDGPRTPEFRPPTVALLRTIIQDLQADHALREIRTAQWISCIR